MSADTELVAVRVPTPQLANLRVSPPPTHAGQEGTSMAAAAAPNGCARLRLHLLSPTIEMDIGTADYATAYPRVLSLDYLFPLCIALGVCGVGFAALKRFCEREAHHYLDDLIDPFPFLEQYGSAGYDDKVDKQWSGFTVQFTKLFGVALLLGAGSAALRRLIALAQYLSHSIRGADTLLSPGASPRSGGYASTGDSEKEPVKAEPVHTIAARAQRALSCAFSLFYPLVRRLVGPWVLPAFYTVVGVVFIAIVHGPHFFVPLLLTLANYVVFTRLQRWCSYRVFMAIMWATHITLLYVIELYEGFENTYVLQYYFPTSFQSTRKTLGDLHARKGLWRQRMRWYVAFRMTTLRLIAFNYDLWEATHCAAQARERAADRHDTACVECAQLREQNSSTSSTGNSTASVPAEASRCYKYRTECARDAADYSLVNYLAYVVFPPLYLAGPMSSFNAFVSHMRVPSTAMPPAHMLRYALRILRVFATEFLLLHYVHVAAIGKHPTFIGKMTLGEQAFYLYYTLAYLWLKFSFIWKSSRLFAMFSGIEAPEDMRRCFSNTFSVRDFWRDWHASFNLWIVRYMYVPMGGRPRVALSVLPIFLFIALWHDPALHLIKWALCIAVMFVVELAVSACFGALVAVFSREMAAAAEGDEKIDAAAAAAADDTPHTPQRSRRGGVAAAVVRPAARFAARHMTPRVRAWCHRMLRVVAGMSTVFGLIVANLIGFSMQNSSANVEKAGYAGKDTEADSVISRALRNLNWQFSGFLALFMYAASSLAVIDRDVVAHEARWLKQKYRLK